MRPISRRDGVWFEPSEFDPAADLVRVTDSAATVIMTAVAIDDIGYATEILATPIWTSPVSDTVTASDAATSFEIIFTADTLTFADVVAGTLAISVTVSDTVSAADSASVDYQVQVSDTVSAADSVAALIATFIEDRLLGFDSVTAYASLSVLSTDVITAFDSIGTGDVQNSEDILIASDASSGTVLVASPTLSDIIIVSDTCLATVASYATVAYDTIMVSDAISGVLALIASASDIVLGSDFASDQEYQVITVVNAETGAVSTYTLPLTVTALAEFHGTLYFVGPNGLYALDASSDYGNAIEWSLRTGFSSLGTDYIKRIQDVNVLSRISDTSNLGVISNLSGVKSTNQYTMPALVRTSYRDGVVKVGKGIASVYYQFTVSGRGPAEIDQLHVTIVPLTRRR